MRRQLLTGILCLLFVQQLASIGGSVGVSGTIFKSALSTDSLQALEAALPPAALQAKQLLTSHGLNRFKLDKSLRSDPLIRQRIVEYLYPIRHDRTANFRLADPNAFLSARCIEIERKSFVVLYACGR